MCLPKYFYSVNILENIPNSKCAIALDKFLVKHHSIIGLHGRIFSILKLGIYCKLR